MSTTNPSFLEILPMTTPRKLQGDKKEPKPKFISGFKRAVGYSRFKEMWKDLKGAKK
jgi:hypothetical protein